MSELRKSFKKDWNYISKRLVNVNKGGTFAPATTKNVHRNTDRNKNWERRNFQKKDSKKLVRFENAFYICTPQNTEVHWEIGRKRRKTETKKKVSNFFKFFLRETKRSFSFAPALRNKRKTKEDTFVDILNWQPFRCKSEQI